MSGSTAVLALSGVAAAITAALYGAARLLAVAPAATGVHPFLSGNAASEHAFSRFHARWYPLTMIYLAFEMEMLFMYPWALVVSSAGADAVIEMFVFLGILLAGVAYAWREGALRWA